MQRTPHTLLRRRELLALAGAMAAAPLAARAQGRVVRFEVGFPPGGSTDVVARLVATHYKGLQGEPAIVENLPGAAGRLVFNKVKSAPPDGSVILASPAAMFTLYPHVYSKLSYDPFKDFVPVTSVGSVSFALVVSTSVVPDSVKTLDDLVAWLKAHPGQRNYASGGAGTPMHFVGEMIARHAGLKLTHVAYKGATPMVQDLLGGQIAMGVTVLGDSLPHLPAGKIRVIGVTSPKRSSYLPEAPTLGELGAPQIVAQEWFGLYLPAGASPQATGHLVKSVREMLVQPEVKSALAKLACDPQALSPADFSRTLQDDLQRWGPVVKATGFRLED